MPEQSSMVRRGPKPRPHTKDNLISAGVDMLHTSGYSATGIKDIVNAAAVPKGSFYNYFDSKESFGQEVVDIYFEQGLVELRKILEDQNVPPIQRLKNYFEDRTKGFVEVGYVRGCLLGNLSLEIADHSASIRERLAQHFKTWSGLFETCIADAQRQGAICATLPAPILAQFLLNSWEGALLRMRAEKSERPLNTFVAVIFGSVLV